MTVQEKDAPRKEGSWEDDDVDIVWGLKQGKIYRDVTIRGESYALNDCVLCRSALDNKDHIGKILKLAEINNKKMAMIRWFFRPSELPESVKGLEFAAGSSKEIFLASGEANGVQNENPLVSSGRGPIVETELPLGMIVGKCRVLCTAEADFNAMPSSQHIQAADYIFSRAFDCDNLEVTTLDDVVEVLGAQKVFNKKEWVADKNAGGPSSQMSSPKAYCPSSGSGCMPNYSNENGIQMPPGYNLPPLKLDSSATIGLGKRQRDEMVMPQSELAKDKRLDASPNPKKPKIPLKLKTNDQNAELMIELRKNLLSGADAQPQSRGKTGQDSPQVSEGSQHSSPNTRLEIAGNSEKRGALKISKSSHTPGALQQLKEGGASAVLETKTIDGPTSVGRKNVGEKLTERHEKVPGKVQKNTSDGKKATPRHDVNEAKTPLAKPGAAGSSKKAAVGSIKKGDEKALLPKKPPNKEKLPASAKPSPTKKSGKPRVDIRVGLDEGNTEQRIGRTVSQSKVQGRSEVNASVLREAATDKVAEVVDLERIEVPQKADERDAQQTPRGQLFVRKDEVWEESIEMAVKKKRVLLLNNIDPLVHSADLEDSLTKFFEVKCEVRKAPPVSFFYESAVALLKLPNHKQAEEVLNRVEEKCLMLGDRVVTVSLYNLTQLTKPLKFYGHLGIHQKPQDEYRNAVATSHGAQGNTIEFSYGVPWRVLQEHHDTQWEILNEYGKLQDMSAESQVQSGCPDDRIDELSVLHSLSNDRRQ